MSSDRVVGPGGAINRFRLVAGGASRAKETDPEEIRGQRSDFNRGLIARQANSRFLNVCDFGSLKRRITRAGLIRSSELTEVCDLSLSCLVRHAVTARGRGCGNPSLYPTWAGSSAGQVRLLRTQDSSPRGRFPSIDCTPLLSADVRGGT